MEHFVQLTRFKPDTKIWRQLTAHWDNGQMDQVNEFAAQQVRHKQFSFSEMIIFDDVKGISIWVKKKKKSVPTEKFGGIYNVNSNRKRKEDGD